jgi:hypothetical protein
MACADDVSALAAADRIWQLEHAKLRLKADLTETV